MFFMPYAKKLRMIADIPGVQLFSETSVLGLRHTELGKSTYGNIFFPKMRYLFAFCLQSNVFNFILDENFALLLHSKAYRYFHEF